MSVASENGHYTGVETKTREIKRGILRKERRSDKNKDLLRYRESNPELVGESDRC
jgi:hypothetical protein